MIFQLKVIFNQTVGAILIGQGLFLLFAFAFNGSVGEKFVNISFCISALTMIILGVSKLVKPDFRFNFILGIVGIVLYLPMIWQRYQYDYCSDCTVKSLDLLIILVLFISLLIRSYKTPKSKPLNKHII